MLTVHASPSASPSSVGLGQCQPQWLGSWLAVETQSQQRPATGWQPVNLPYLAAEDPTLAPGALWFRVQWRLDCPLGRQRDPQLALAIAGVGQAAQVYWNEQLLWQSPSLIEPLSQGWNLPQQWPVAVHAPQDIQTLWVRVVSNRDWSRGLGAVTLADRAVVEQLQAQRQWRQRTSYIAACGMALVMACVSLALWWWRRSEHAYGWLGLMQAFWGLYLSMLLSTAPWWGMRLEWFTALMFSAFLVASQCFLVFTLRFVGQRCPWVERCGWAAVLVCMALLLPLGHAWPWQDALALVCCSLLIGGSSCYAQWRAWRTRNPRHILLALCWLVMLVVVVHDLPVALQVWGHDQTWVTITGPVTMGLLGVLLGWRLADDMARVDGFNAELAQRVAQAQAQLSASLAREHEQALLHAKLQERTQLAHDLHDGLGGSLVRSMAAVEYAGQPLSNARMLSMLKSLRDDLRQIIDVGASSGTVVPATPVEWLAPLRHRINRVLEALNMQTHWQVDAQWQRPPSVAQCLALLRILEECCANIIKHSHAQQMRVVCTQTPSGELQLMVCDDGVGFDVEAVHTAALSVGMRSMRARAERIGARMVVRSQPGATVVEVCLQVQAPAQACDDGEIKK